MPIQIYVEVNGRPVESYNIARIANKVNDDELTDYTVLRSGANKAHDASYRGPTYKQWDDGLIVAHKRSDGLEVLLQKALTALTSEAKDEGAING